MLEKLSTKNSSTVLTGLQIKQLQKLLGGMANINLSADKITIQLDKIVLKLEK